MIKKSLAETETTKTGGATNDSYPLVELTEEEKHIKQIEETFHMDFDESETEVEIEW